MVTYKVFRCKGKATYGIVASDSEGCKVCRIDDISANGEAVFRLTELMNREQLSLVHFRDAVEDFLVVEY